MKTAASFLLAYVRWHAQRQAGAWLGGLGDVTPPCDNAKNVWAVWHSVPGIVHPCGDTLSGSCLSSMYPWPNPPAVSPSTPVFPGFPVFSPLLSAISCAAYLTFCSVTMIASQSLHSACVRSAPWSLPSFLSPQVTRSNPRIGRVVSLMGPSARPRIAPRTEMFVAWKKKHLLPKWKWEL